MNVNVMVEFEIILSVFEMPTRVTQVISRRMRTNVLEFCSPERSDYSQTCLKQAAKGNTKIACLRQVLA